VNDRLAIPAQKPKQTLRGDVREVMRRFYEQEFTVYDIIDALRRRKRYKDRVGLVDTVRSDLYRHYKQWGIVQVKKGNGPQHIKSLYANKEVLL
jgi:hypothetical protein